METKPYVANGVVYIERMLSRLYALDAMTGHEKWSFDTASMACGPVIVNGFIYTVGRKGLFALNEATSALQWMFEQSMAH